MIAQRFRPVGWVAGVAIAATALYMISLRVATERGRLEEIDHKISLARRDIRQLQTELGTRASLRQLERWNGEVLALSAPQVGQYLPGEQALASADSSALGKKPASPPAIMTAVSMTQDAPSATQTPAQPAVVAVANPSTPSTVAVKAHPVAPLVRVAVKSPAAAKAKPKPLTKPERVAMLDRDTIRTLAHSASNEAGGKAKK